MSEPEKSLLLHDAARRGDITAVRDLLERCADTKMREPETGNTPLHVAALSGQTECVEALLPHSIPNMVNQQKLTAVCIAAAAGDLPTVKVFFKNERKQHFLSLARRAMRVASTYEVMQFLLTVVPNIGEMRKGGYRALAAAAEQGHVEAMRALLLIGVKPQKAHKDGKGAAVCAAENGRLECLRLLLDHGISITSVDAMGHTLLHKAVLGDSKQCVELLVSRGANINTKAARGTTPLHLAAKCGKAQSVEALLQLGADRTTADKAKQLPLDYAKRYNFKEIIDLLSA